METLFKEEATGIVLFREQLAEMIRARTPLIYLGTIEVKRSLEEIRMVCSEVGAELRVFSLASGVLEFGREKMSTDPIALLDMIMKQSKKATLESTHTIWALPLFHLFLRQPEALILSRLREIIEFGKFMHTVIITGCPNFSLPPEIADVPTMELPLPTLQEIRGMLDYPIPAEDKKEIGKNLLGFRMNEIEELIARSLVRQGRVDSETIKGLRDDWVRKKANDCLEISFPRETLDQVGGMGALKRWLELRKPALLDFAAFKKYGLPAPKGILLTGVPGCGKSLVCRAIAGSWGLPLLRLDPAKIYSSSLGASEKNFLDSLAIASSVSPCVFWIDEIEKGFSPTDSQTDGGVSKRILGTFLNFLQERESSVFVVATSNNLSSLPPEMLRKGRWDEIFFIDLPSFEERPIIFQVLLKKYRCELNIDEDLLSLSKGYSGAEIEQAIIAALYEAFSRKASVHLLDIKRNLHDITPISASMKKMMETLREWGNSFARPVTLGRDTAPVSSPILFISSREKRIS